MCQWYIVTRHTLLLAPWRWRGSVLNSLKLLRAQGSWYEITLGPGLDDRMLAYHVKDTTRIDACFELFHPSCTPFFFTLLPHPFFAPLIIFDTHLKLAHCHGNSTMHIVMATQPCTLSWHLKHSHCHGNSSMHIVMAPQACTLSWQLNHAHYHSTLTIVMAVEKINQHFTAARLTVSLCVVYSRGSQR